jgi:hypothetical protein
MSFSFEDPIHRYTIMLKTAEDRLALMGNEDVCVFWYAEHGYSVTYTRREMENMKALAEEGLANGGKLKPSRVCNNKKVRENKEFCCNGHRMDESNVWVNPRSGYATCKTCNYESKRRNRLKKGRVR